MIRMSSSGNTNNMDKFLSSILRGDPYKGIERVAEEGVMALKSATPRESGLTADMWEYEIEKSDGLTTIWWINKNVTAGFNVAVGLQYGHVTGTGGWVSGYDYINPALKPIFDKIADQVWKEVTRA